MSDETVVPDLYRLAFIPGNFRCPKCDFRLSKACLNADTMEVGTREQERQSEPCPNDGTMMVHVTYAEVVGEYSDRLKVEFDQVYELRQLLLASEKKFTAHTEAVASFLNELYMIMIDPLAEEKMPVSEMMGALKKAALEHREYENNRDHKDY